MIDSKILQRALDWNKYPKGIRIFLDTEVSSIQNTEVRDAILLDEKKQALAPKFYRGKKRKTWYDSSTNAIHVILSNIESPRELDRVILNEVLLRRGLAGLVGDDVMNRIANAVFDGQDEQTRKTFLSYVLGNNDMETDRIAAGKLYLRSQANQYAKAVTSQSKENAGKAWYSMVRKYIRPYAPQLFSFLSEETSLSHIIGAGIRAHAFYDSYSAKMSEVSSSRVRDEIVKLYNRELEGRTLDLGRYIHLGRPGDILLASAPWTKTCPVILPLVSLYENMEDGRHERYITSVEDIKKEKHPFSLLQVLNLRDELESPLAVFKSVKRDRGLVFMLPSKGGKTADASKMEHFAVPISLQEINYTENSGLRKSYGSGKWVNYIHSIYPKNDSGYLCWLSVPGLCSYLSPSFEEKWLKPAETRLEERFEHLFKAEGIKKPSAGEIKEILNNLSADDYIDIKSKLAKFQDLNEAGLPKVYSVYRDVLESATKIVKEFENPKIISQKNIEFSIQDEDLSPRMMMEKVLGEFMENNPEKLRRIAYLCVKGSPALGNELLPVNPVSYVADMKYGELKETIMEHWQKLSEDARISIHAEFPELPNLSLDENTKYEDARKLFFTLTLDDKCRFMGFDGKNDAWKDLMNWHPLGGPDWKLDEDMLSGGIDDMFKQATAEEVIEKYIEWKNDGFKASETYALAKDITMFMVNKLNEHGIKTVMVPEEKAREILEKERGSEGEGLERIDFSVRDIMNLSYTWNGEEVSMRGFAEQFMSEIKQKDRTMEDAERIAKAFIEAVKADPEKAGMKMLKAENMANAFRFKLPDGTIYTPEHPLASSPEYETQRGLWLIYENVLGRETMNEFVGLLSKNAPMSVEERKRFTELESKVNGSDLMQRSLEVPASKVNENRVRDIRNLIQYFKGNEDYTWTEKALIVKGAMSFGYSEKKESDQTKVEIKNISDNNSVAVPVIGGEAAAVVDGLRKGLNFKDALVQARISLSKESKRSVERNFTGWKVYKQSDKEEDAVILNQDVAGTGWCTGGAVSTARSHLSGGDFHVYYEAGEPLIAIRTQDGHMAEPPRGAHEGQFCTDREEQIAFDYIKSGNGIIAGDDYIADIEDIRRIMSPDATPVDAFMFPEKRRYKNGAYGGDTSAWGEVVERRIAELIPEGKEERWKLGFYYSSEIEEACRNGYVKAIKGDIYLNGSVSLTVPEGVTQVKDIRLEDFTSLTIPGSVTQVKDIRLYDSASLTLHEGVTQVRDIYLRNAASLTIPESVTRVRDIYLYGFYGGSASLTLPEGVTQVKDIRLNVSSSLTILGSVTQVRNIYLYGSSSLTLHEGVTQVRGIYLDGSSSLTILGSVTQVEGDVLFAPGTSITFPDGFVLRNDTKGRRYYTSEEINEILSEHQKKTEFRLSNGTVYGYQLGDTIYLTPEGINPNTPIHEYAHLWAKVYEKLHPDEWESLKEELKTLPQWREIAESESYSFIESDENRLAGEVLATIVGNKGEELMLSAARDTLEEGKRTDESVAKGAEYFRQLVTDMAVKDVFDAEGMERTGEVTLKVLKDFAEGKGVKVSKEEGKKLAAMAEFERNRVKTTEYISKSNSRFNEELQKQIDGEFDLEPHTYNLGYPGPILRSTGIPNLPIQVTSTKLYEKSNSDKHKYALDEIKDLVKHINTPVAVFIYGDGTLAQNIIVDIEHGNSHFLVGMSLNAHIKGSALEINSIRNVFPKDNYKWMEWIQEGKSRYMDKEKIKVLIAQQRTSPADVNHLDLDFVANIVEKFKNPKVDEKYFIIDNWQYYGVFLDDRAQSIIDREFRELIPSGWRKHADHVTVLYNDYSNDMIAKGRSLAKTLGQERTMRIVALGKSDTAIALMVEGVETENKIAHITLATSPDGKPVDSNFITEWKPVEQIDISGRLGLSYKGKKYFEVLSDNDVVDFQINKNNMAKQVHQQSSEKKDTTVAISGLMKDADFKTLQKAALFAAWETREDNPYEFVVDMSRNELAEFLSNAEKKLNDEDRDIVSKILSHEPGYGEDYVEKQMNAKQSFRPDIETLLVDDLTVGGDVLDRALFYLATKDMNDAQLQQLRDNVRKKAVDFYSNMDKKNALPGHKDAEKFVDKQLHSWFRPWTRLAGKLEHQLDEIHMSDSGQVSLKDIEATARDAMADPVYANYINRELKGWIRNRCADYGLDYTKLPEDLQYEGAAETYRQMFPEYVKDTKIDTLTRDAIKAGKDFEIVDKPVEADRDADRYPLGIEFREIYPDWVKDGYDAVWAAEHGLMVHVCSQTRRELSIGSVTDEKIEAQIDEMALFQYHVLEGHDKYEQFPDFRYSKFKPHWLDDRSRYNFLVDRALENISVSLLDNPVSQGLPDFVKKDFIRNLFSEFDAKRFSVSKKSLFCYSDDNGLIQPLEVTLSRNGTPLVVVGDRILHQFNPDIETLTRDAILAHIDKITALYPQYPQVPTKVSLKPDGSIVRQYGEFEYEQIKGGFERSKNLVLVEELDGETLQRKALYSMSSDSYGEHPNGPYVRFWDNGSIRSYENCSVRVGSDNGFESDMLSFTREGIVQEKIPGDYPIEPFLEDITNEYMKTMTKREGLEPNATANKIDSALLSTWFISLPLEDKMRVFGYYHNNPENENSPIGDDIEKLEAAYKEAVEAPHDVPEVEEIVIRKGIEERLASAFESLSYDSKGQIYRETVESGIPGLNQTQRSILNDAHTAKMSEELKTLAIECAARKSFLNGFDYDISVLNTEKMSDSELYSFVSKNLSVLSIEQLAEAQRILEKWRGIHGMMHENDTIDKRFSKYFAPHCEAVLERTGLDLNELHQSLPQKEFARLIRGQEVLIDGTVNTKEGPSNGLWSFRISPAKPGPDNPGFSFYLYPVEYHDGPNGKIPEHKMLQKGEDLVIKGRHFKAGSDEVEQWRLTGRGIVLETPSGLELVTPGKYDSTVGIARSVSYIEKRLTSLEHADLHLRPFKDDGSIKKEKTKGFQIGGEDIPKLARGEEVVLTTKDGVKACVRYDCGENNLIEVVPFAIAKRMELRDELKQKDKANLEKVIKEVSRPSSKKLDTNIRKK